MTINQLIFSNDRKHQIAKHLSVWDLFCEVCFYTNIEVHNSEDLRIINNKDLYTNIKN